MVKSKKIVVAAVLLVAVISLTAFVACVNTDLSEYNVSEEFSSALASYDLARSEDSDVRIMSFNILAHMESWGGSPVPPRAVLLLEMLEKVNPDVIGVQEMSSDWHKVLSDNWGDKYEIVHPDIDFINKNKTPIVYNTETMTLVESGYTAYSEGDENGCRAITWALFGLKNEAGKYVVVTNTHLNLIKEGQESKSLSIMQRQADELIAKIDELGKQYSFSVVACGDYNCAESGEVPDLYGKTNGEYAASAVYEKLAKALTDIKYSEGVSVECADASVAQAPDWDHIFVKGDAKASRFVILYGKEFEAVSDHFALFADIRL